MALGNGARRVTQDRTAPLAGASEMQSSPAAGVGILLANLGTPDAPTKAALRRYLGEFLWDPRLVEYPRAREARPPMNATVISMGSTDALYVARSD